VVFDNVDLYADSIRFFAVASSQFISSMSWDEEVYKVVQRGRSQENVTKRGQNVGVVRKKTR
jgi:hypothetical protein